MMTTTAWVLFACLAPRPTSPAVARADDAWAAGRYAEAAEAYAVAYAESGDIAYLFARGQAQREAGDCVGATATFEAFIATEPLPQAVQAARVAIEECRAQLPAPVNPPSTAIPEPKPTAPNPPVTADVAATRVDPPPPAKRWRRDPTAVSLLAVGGATSVVGTTLAIVARNEQSQANRAADVVAFGEHNDRAVTLSRASIPLLAIGGALVLGGVIRYVVLARRERTARHTSALWPLRF